MSISITQSGTSSEVVVAVSPTAPASVSTTPSSSSTKKRKASELSREVISLTEDASQAVVRSSQRSSAASSGRSQRIQESSHHGGESSGAMNRADWQLFLATISGPSEDGAELVSRYLNAVKFLSSLSVSKPVLDDNVETVLKEFENSLRKTVTGLEDLRKAFESTTPNELNQSLSGTCVVNIDGKSYFAWTWPDAFTKPFPPGFVLSRGDTETVFRYFIRGDPVRGIRPYIHPSFVARFLEKQDQQYYTKATTIVKLIVRLAVGTKDYDKECASAINHLTSDEDLHNAFTRGFDALVALINEQEDIVLQKPKDLSITTLYDHYIKITRRAAVKAPAQSSEVAAPTEEPEA